MCASPGLFCAGSWRTFDKDKCKTTNKMAKKSNTLLKLESTAGTGTFFVKKRNPRKLIEKLEFKKYDPKIRKHVVFKEKKMK